MKLYEILEKTDGNETTVWDKDYDMETYFYYSDSTTDKWDMAMMKIAKALEVTSIHDGGYECNISEVIEKHIGEEDFDSLFVDSDIDAIMDDIENILAGNVSENWITKFAETLSK